MLPRKNLIPLKKEFSRIRKEGKLYDSPSFGLIVEYRKEVGVTQAAFVVSKKVSLKSVVRHQVKRKLADSLATFFPRLPKTVELVFLAKGKAVSTDPEGLKKEMELILQRARLL